ncbi:HAD family hydrolase [candidate division KSB1 bacterium]|nr:HAD family hydrolase [candidate division KSB1 bacterium]
MIRWVFFDVGNVILNDDPALAMLYKLLYDSILKTGKNVSLAQLFTRRESLIGEQNGYHYRTIAQEYLGEKNWHAIYKAILRKLSENWLELCPLMPGVLPVLKSIHNDFDLGIIANQPKEVMPALEKHGLLAFFKVLAISQIVGASKPDAKIYNYALKQANCDPCDAIMIGDRIDNDIHPAKMLGMRTIWLTLRNDEKGFIPKENFQKLYLESVERGATSKLPPQNETEQPDIHADSFAELENAIRQINTSG